LLISNKPKNSARSGKSIFKNHNQSCGIESSPPEVTMQGHLTMRNFTVLMWWKTDNPTKAKNP